MWPCQWPTAFHNDIMGSNREWLKRCDNGSPGTAAGPLTFQKVVWRLLNKKSTNTCLLCTKVGVIKLAPEDHVPASRTNLVSLILHMKFYWHSAVLICLSIVHGHFCTTLQCSWIDWLSPGGQQGWKSLPCGPYGKSLLIPALLLLPLGRGMWTEWHVMFQSTTAHSHPLLPKHVIQESRDWFLLSISEFSYLLYDIRHIALPRRSLGRLHTYSKAGASGLDVARAVL
jgi:hypothetical protein